LSLECGQQWRRNKVEESRPEKLKREVVDMISSLFKVARNFRRIAEAYGSAVLSQPFA
jgi:hypothetical protein